MKKTWIPLLLALALALTACAAPGGMPALSQPETTAAPRDDSPAAVTTPQQSQTGQVTGAEEYFSDRDLAGTYDEADAVSITLGGGSATCADGGVTVDGSVITVTEEGTYILSGTLDDGMIIVDTDKKDKVQLVLQDAHIHSETSAPIYVRQADKVFVTLAAGTENALTNGGAFENIDENNIDAVIFSKEDLTLNGSGSLTIQSPAGHGVVSKDELTVAGGSYAIESASHGLSGKDNVCIAGGSLAITAGKDGIQADNDEDETLGFVWIEGGDFDITAEGDGISGSASVDILGGSFAILTGGGSANGEKKTSDGWGGFGGGPGGPMGGDRGGRGQSGFTAETEDSTSIKGIKAGGDLGIWGGSFTLNCADDAVHSNANVTVRAGTFQIATGDDGFHADGNLTVNGGTVNVTQSYEGLEGLSVDIGGGDIRLACTDDGINAAGGADQSGFGGMRGGDRFGGGSADSYIHISGGTVYMNASGDGIDSNGTLLISGGHTTVCGPTQGDTAVLDFEISGTITGGTFIGTGAYMMAQTFTEVQNQSVIPVSVGNRKAGTLLTLQDSQGNVILSVTPEMDYAIAILSCPEILSGETYTLTVGDESAQFTAR